MVIYKIIIVLILYPQKYYASILSSGSLLPSYLYTEIMKCIKELSPKWQSSGNSINLSHWTCLQFIKSFKELGRLGSYIHLIWWIIKEGKKIKFNYVLMWKRNCMHIRGRYRWAIITCSSEFCSWPDRRCIKLQLGIQGLYWHWLELNMFWNLTAAVWFRTQTGDT